jgi:hypothetical protein
VRLLHGDAEHARDRRAVGLDNASSLYSVIFVTLVIGGASLAGTSTLAIYALSFWHYYLYGLAFVFGAVSLGVFKRDAILMKSVALVALISVYLSAAPDLLSLAVAASGFLLNSVAAAALGSDRTYYGHEVAGLPQHRTTAFPYSVMAHPMLIGNVAAFGGTMINAEFRQQWWVLACGHVAMNIGLLAMEVYVTPQRRSTHHGALGGPVAPRFSWRTGGCLIAAGGAAGALASFAAQASGALLPAWIGACSLGYGYVLYCCYMAPVCFGQARRETLAEKANE